MKGYILLIIIAAFCGCTNHKPSYKTLLCRKWVMVQVHNNHKNDITYDPDTCAFLTNGLAIMYRGKHNDTSRWQLDTVHMTLSVSQNGNDSDYSCELVLIEKLTADSCVIKTKDNDIIYMQSVKEKK